MKTLLLSLLFMTLPVLSSAEPRQGSDAVVFHTDCGDMVAALYPDEAPKHVAQILRLVRGGIYTHTQFFRTDKGYVTQVENYNMRNPALNAEESALIEKIPAEFNSIHHRRGILSMARFDDPNSAEASFSFVLGEAPNLDGKYTVFGEVIRNKEVLDEIEKLPPKSVYINSAEVVALADVASLNLTPAHSMFIRNVMQSQGLQIFLFSILILLGLYAFDIIYNRKNPPVKK